MNLVPDVKDATEAIQQVPPLVEAIVSLLQTPAGWFVLAVLFFWLLVNKDFSHIFDMFERKERRQFEYLDLYIAKSELADEESVKVLRDLRDAHYFKVATGIYAEKKLRRALINLHDRTSHFISWTQIRRAFRYIETSEDGIVEIRKLRKFEAIGYWYNELIAYVCLLLAAGLLNLFLFSDGRNSTSVAWGIISPLAAVFFAMFVFAQNWPILAARRIQKELMKIPSQHGKRT